ncbi:MAG TPA: hypothetical protein VFW46_21030 [Stellaceae bacterium]|nr:hypothetical protein [Stellaceae bacterium]
MSDDSVLPIPAGWQVYVPMLTSLIRDILNILGAGGFTWALTVNGSQVQMAVSVALVLVASVWGKIQKAQANRALEVAANNPKGAPAPKLPA